MKPWWEWNHIWWGDFRCHDQKGLRIFQWGKLSFKEVYHVACALQMNPSLTKSPAIIEKDICCILWALRNLQRKRMTTVQCTWEKKLMPDIKEKWRKSIENTTTNRWLCSSSLFIFFLFSKLAVFFFCVMYNLQVKPSISAVKAVTVPVSCSGLRSGAKNGFYVEPRVLRLHLRF